jgi:hypothetical protein
VAIVSAPPAAQGTTVAFDRASSDAPESLAKPTIAVRLSEPSTETVSVHYTVTGGTATRGTTSEAPTDFILPDGELTFAPGAVVQTIPIQVVNDKEPEPAETVLLALSAPQNAALGAQADHTFTIFDNDSTIKPVVEFAADSSAADESVGTAKLAVVVYPPSKKAVSVTYTVSGGTATPGEDYALDAGTLGFAAGETTKVISLAVMDDTDVESSETVLVHLSNPQGAVVGYKETHTFTILDNDKPPEVFVSFQAAKSTVPESAGTSSIAVVVTGGPRTENVTVSYGVTGGTAQGGGVDYTVTAGTLVFTPDQAVQSIPVQFVDDSLVELDETAGIALTNPVGAKLGKYSSHELTIRDNDLPFVSFASAASQANEGNGPLPVTLVLSQASPRPVLVDYSLGGTATQGEDYSLNIGTVTFVPGDVSAEIVPDILDDDLAEPEETLVLTLAPPLDAKLGTPSVHTVTIKDNDEQKKPTVSFEAAASLGDEFVGALSIPVQLSYALQSDLTVPLEVGGTATKGVDYVLAAETVTFPAGTTRASITGTITDDALDEADESVIFTLKGTSSVKLAEPQLHTYTIMDNDYALAELSLFKQETGTVNGKILTVLGPKALSVEPRGMAVDTAGNYYVSDWGPTPGGAEREGGILFWPRGGKAVVRIVTGLTRPGDVEMSTDQQALLIAGEAGKVQRLPLGLSVKFTNIDPFEGGLVVHVFGAGPEKVVKVSPDGYFHIPDLLGGGTAKPTVDITVERRGTSRTFTAVPLGQPDGLYGHRVAKLEF